ncbi:MAG: hypothetical protein SF053_05435 [Bacteroidia bacterium]|nr:hypothetical protein [Bacteroidia bacterium]
MPPAALIGAGVGVLRGSLRSVLRYAADRSLRSRPPAPSRNRHSHRCGQPSKKYAGASPAPAPVS